MAWFEVFAHPLPSLYGYFSRAFKVLYWLRNKQKYFDISCDTPCMSVCVNACEKHKINQNIFFKRSYIKMQMDIHFSFWYYMKKLGGRLSLGSRPVLMSLMQGRGWEVQNWRKPANVIVEPSPNPIIHDNQGQTFIL